MINYQPAAVIALFFLFGGASGTENTDPARGAFVRENILTRLARRMEPDLAGEPQRIDQYVSFLQSEIANDKRLFAFDVVPEIIDEKKVRLTGFIEFPETRRSLVAYLELLGFTVEDSLQSLPAEDLGEKNLGILSAPQSFSYDRPSGRRTTENQCLLGEPLYLLREEDGHLLVHSGEGYLGYVNADDILRVDETQFADYLEGARVRFLADHQVNDTIRVPAGARLKLDDTTDRGVSVVLPTGESVTVPQKVCEIVKTPRAQLRRIEDQARQLLGTKYKWGGRSSRGVDCSGLVQLAYAAAGYQLPRDSYQQIYVGQLSATRWHRSRMRPGDTLYFLGSDGKIRHTGMYLGGDRFIQAVIPRVRISSLNPDHDDYDASHARSFAFAKRPLE